MRRENLIRNLNLACCYYIFSAILCYQIGNAHAWAGNNIPGKRVVPTGGAYASKGSPFRIGKPSRGRSTHHVRPLPADDDDGGSDGDRGKQLSKVLLGFVKSLGQGIMFAIPMKPAVTHALFGIKGKRRNDKSTTNSAPSVSFTLKEGLIAIGIYFLVGVCGYSLLMEHWSFIDAVYFSVVSFTSVGYGDLYPHTMTSKLFTCAFSLGGIAFLAAALATIGSNLVEAELKAVKAAQKLGRSRVMRMFENMPQLLSKRTKKSIRSSSSTVTTVVPFNATSILTGEPLLPRPKAKTGWDVARDVAGKLMRPFAFLVVGGVGLGRLEGWSVGDSIYYAIITAGTVGFGDFSPTTQQARLCAILFIPLAVAAGGDILGTIASALLERRRGHVFDNLINKDFTMDHIKEMDSDGDGQVSRLEYTEFMLVEMKLVEKSVLVELRDQFNRLDMTMSDSITKEDLILMAKLRRNKPAEQEESS